MIWLILISLFLLLITWILLGPVILFVDTNRNKYHVALPGVFKVAVVPSEFLFTIRGWIFFVPFKFDPFKRRRKKKKKSRKKKDAKKRSLKKRRVPGITMIVELIRSIRIRKLDLDVDTDDFSLNAYLIPVFSAVNSGNILMRANFEGRISLVMDIRIRIGTLIWIMIKHKYKSTLTIKL